MGSDHGGFELKQALADALRRRGHRINDVGTHDKESCDYPDYAAAVARAVAMNEAVVGIMVDGAGLGSAMACNKFPGLHAAPCHDTFTAANAREHNHANILCLGSNVVSEQTALEIAETFLATTWGGGRHTRRNRKVAAIEQAFVGGGL